MRTTLLAVLGLAFCAAVRGQTADYDYRYWFDADDSAPVTGTLPNRGGARLEVDASALAPQLHTLHFQLRDSLGRWSSPRSCRFVKVPAGDAPLEYWWDASDAGRRRFPTEAAALSALSAAGLPEGLHALRVQAGGESPSAPATRYFMRAFRTQGADSLFCIATVDSAVYRAGRVPYADGALHWGVPVEGLTQGVHKIQLQIVTDGGTVSSTDEAFFLRAATDGEIGRMRCFYVVDNFGPGTLQEAERTADGLFRLAVDVSALPFGLHRLSCMLTDDAGLSTDVRTAFFLRVPDDLGKAGLKCFYTLDASGGRVQEAARSDGGSYFFDLDVSDLPDGLHRLHCVLTDEIGLCYGVRSAFFVKGGTAADGIAAYDYWLNGDLSGKRSIVLDEAQNPFRLSGLIEVGHAPLRPEDFLFEPGSGVAPTLYPCNEFHISFRTAAGNAAEASSRYVDFGAPQAVVPESDVLSSGRYSASVPDSLGIRWFRVPLSAGDSLSLKADCPCRLQVFAPDGEVAAELSGEAALSYGGCTARGEGGDYYVALHSVATGAGTEVSVDFLLHRADEPTGLEDIRLQGGTDDRGALYDLQGRRVERPVRGNVYLRRGEKILY